MIESKPSIPNRLEYYKTRYRRAWSIAAQWYSIQEACYHYCIPSRDLFYYTNQTQGAQKNVKVFDTTGISATTKFVSKVQDALTPPQQVWALLEAGSEIPEDFREEANKYLQDTTNKIFDYIRHSNFDLAINECYYDLAVGTAVLQVNEGPDKDPLRFYSVPLAQACFEESVNGFIESAYRTWGEVRIQELKIMWPNARLPEWIETAFKNDPNASVKNLYEGVVYVLDDEKPYKYVLWIDSDILLEEEDISSPWVIFRWSKTNNECMGRGPIMNALPALLSLNEIFRLELTSANMNVCKPLMAYSDGVFNPWTFKLTANTVIPIAPSMNGQAPIIPFPDTANPNFEQLVVTDLRQQINALMYADPLGPIDSPTKTATELALRQKSLAEEIGPLFTRLQQEFLSRVIQRIIHILQIKGLLEPLVIDGREIMVRYQSPLVVAQGKQDVMGFMDYYAALTAIFQGNALNYIDPVKTPIWIAEKLGIDKNLVPEKDRLEEVLKNQSEQAQEMQLQAMQAGGQPG